MNIGLSVLVAALERKAVPSVKAQPRPRTAKMDAFMAKVHANPRYEVENVAASMSAALVKILKDNTMNFCQSLFNTAAR